MIFDPTKVAFGRHESFPLRFGWLTKGFQALQSDPGVFSSDDAIVTLGVGKNMVNSIRHWLKATSMIDVSPIGLQPTQLGSAMFSVSGLDPYLEDEASIWLIHWMLATNPDQATTWYWFFNRFHKPEFSSKEVSTALSDFAKENIRTKFSLTTLKKDAAVLLRTYVQRRSSPRTPVEEVLDSPLSLLKLVSYFPETKMYHSKLGQQDNLPIGIFCFAINDFLNRMNISECPIEDLMYSRDGQIAPGAIFRLTEDALLTKIERLISYIPGAFKIDDTAGIHQLYKLKKVNSFEYLKKHYVNSPEKAAA